MYRIIFLFMLVSLTSLRAQSIYSDYKRGEPIMHDDFDSWGDKWDLEDFQISDGWLRPLKHAFIHTTLFGAKLMYFCTNR